MRKKTALGAAAVLGFVLWMWSARAPRGGGAAVAPFPEAPVVLIVIDTLRADRLPVHGYAAGATPAVDALAREGVVFEDVYSHCPLTLPAHASLFTGLLPPRHGVRDNMGFSLDAAHRTVASRFRDAGLATGGAVSAYVLRRATGIAAGFDFYDDAVETDASLGSLGDQQRDGAVAVDAIARWIEERAGRRFFAFLHLYEPHAPWTPPAAHRAHSDAYDGEVAYADELVGRFVARLRTAGVLDRAIVAVTSDHGEGLGDHGESEHGLFLYREALRVPLVVRLPGARAAGTRVTGVVAQADVPVTLLDLAAVPHGGMEGISQRPAMTAGAAASRPVYSETFFPRYHFGWSELLAVTDGRIRYIRAPRPELFDLASDAGEKRNIVAERSAAAAAMSAWLDGQARGPAPVPAAVPAEVRERLEALGYVGGGSASAESAAARPDPKDEVESLEAFKAANALRQQGRDAEAAAALRALLARRPRMIDARELLGVTLAAMGRAEEARAALEAVVAEDSRRGSAHLALARLHAAAARRDEAARHAALAVDTQPGEAYEMLAQLDLDQGRLDAADAFARQAVAADPDRPVAHFVLGLVARRRGRCDDALAALAAAAEARARRRRFVMPGLFAATGDCLARLGREQEAEKAFLAEVAQVPFSREGRVGLAMLYRSQARDAAAREAIAGVVTAHPKAGPEEYWTVVRTLRGLGDEVAAREWAQRARARFPRDQRFR